MRANLGRVHRWHPVQRVQVQFVQPAQAEGVGIAGVDGPEEDETLKRRGRAPRRARTLAQLQVDRAALARSLAHAGHREGVERSL